jgi:hypothetical protein
MLFMDIEDPLMFFAVKYHEGRAGSPESDQLTGATFLGRLVLGLLILGRLKNGNKKMRLSVSICMLMLLMAPQAYGQIKQWNNSAADNDFANHANWTGSLGNFTAEPNAQWDINLGVGANKATIGTDIGDVFRDVRIGDAGTQGELEVTATGSLTITRDLRLARSGGVTGQAIMTVNGGSVTVATVAGTGNIFIGQSDNPGNPTVFTLNSGSVSTMNTLNVAHQANNKGSLVINGGTFTAGNAVLADGNTAPSVASLTVTGGSLTTTTGGFTFASSAGSNTATVTLSGSGEITSATSIAVGFGTNSTATVNMSGGTMNAPNSFVTFGQGAGSTTTVTMSGGAINADRINWGNNATANSTLNMTGGALTMTAAVGSTADNRGSLVLQSGNPQLNISGNSQISAERLLINAGGNIDLAGASLLHLKGSTRETVPGSGVLESTAPTLSFAQQFFSGLWAEVLGKVNFSSLDSILRVEGASETIANSTLGAPDLVLNFADLFNAAISNSVFTSSLSGATFVVEFDGTHTIVRLESSVPPAQIVNRFAFHAGYSGLGSNIDSGKVLAREGAGPLPLEYVNLINSAQGINGVGFDIQDLAGSLTAADFDFQISPLGAFVEGSNPPAGWAAAPAPSTVTVIAGAPSRVLVEWANQSIMNRWLRITVKANANTGLTAPEVFYLGHLLGETTGSQSGPFTVAFADITPIRSVVGGVVNANSIHDIDKNGTVSFADISAMRPNVGAQLTNITIP